MSNLNMLNAQEADLRSVGSATGLSCDAPSSAPDSKALEAFQRAMQREDSQSFNSQSGKEFSSEGETVQKDKGQTDETAASQFASLFSMPSLTAQDGGVHVTTLEGTVSFSPLSEAELEMLVDRILVSQAQNGSQEVRITLGGTVLNGTEITLFRNSEGLLVVQMNCTNQSSFQTLVASQLDLRTRLEDFENNTVHVSVDIRQDGNDAQKRSKGYFELDEQQA